jgi:hypothetical protein
VKSRQALLRRQVIETRVVRQGDRRVICAAEPSEQRHAVAAHQRIEVLLLPLREDLAEFRGHEHGRDQQWQQSRQHEQQQHAAAETALEN